MNESLLGSTMAAKVKNGLLTVSTVNTPLAIAPGTSIPTAGWAIAPTLALLSAAANAARHCVPSPSSATRVTAVLAVAPLSKGSKLPLPKPSCSGVTLTLFAGARFSMVT